MDAKNPIQSSTVKHSSTRVMNSKAAAEDCSSKHQMLV